MRRGQPNGGVKNSEESLVVVYVGQKRETDPDWRNQTYYGESKVWGSRCSVRQSKKKKGGGGKGHVGVNSSVIDLLSS